MAAITSGRNAAEFILAEGPGNFSREGATVAAGQTLVAGEVVDMNGAGELVAWLSDSGGNPVGVSIYNVDATDGAVSNCAYIARHAELNVHLVTYPSGQLVATRAGLLTLDIILR